jgi:hypothetical protein
LVVLFVNVHNKEITDRIAKPTKLNKIQVEMQPTKKAMPITCLLKSGQA